MDRKLEEVEIFVTVVERGTMTAAARQLGVSKSHISRTMSRLEERLGAVLLTRNSRTSALTAVGEAYYERCSEALTLIDHANRAVAMERGEPRGMLRLTAPMSFGVRYIAEALGEFQVQHPELEVEVDYSDRVVDLVNEGFDLAIRIGNLPDSDLVARRIGTASTVIAASPDYLERHGTPTTADELRAHPMVRYSLLSRAHIEITDPGGRVYRLPLRGPHAANTGDAVVATARAGLAILSQPRWMVVDDLEAGTLVELLADHQQPELGIWAVYPSAGAPLPKVAAFADFLRDRLTNVP